MELFTKNEVIFDEIPEEYRKMILNSLIARAISDGSLELELELYLMQDEIDEMKDNLGFDFTTTRKRTKKTTSGAKGQNLFTNHKKKIEKDANIKEKEDDNTGLFSY